METDDQRADVSWASPMDDTCRVTQTGRMTDGRLIPESVGSGDEAYGDPAGRSTDAIGLGETAAQGLDRVLDDLGAALLQVLAGDPARSPAVSGVVIQAPQDPDPVPAGSVVLGVGVRRLEDVKAALHRLGSAGASALVVATPIDVDDEISDLVEMTGVGLLGLSEGAQWQQLSSLLAVHMRRSPDPLLGGSSIGGRPAGDLFGLANAIGALIGAPITIEDRNTNVLAFSDYQADADFIRIECILGRRTPDLYAREDELRGAYKRIRQADGPVFLEAMGLDDDRETLPRVAMAVRAGDEVLGSIWAVVREPLSPEKESLFIDASRLAALHLLQLRAGADGEERVVMDLVATTMEGGAPSAGALSRLDLDRHPLLVLALHTPSDPSKGPDARVLGQLTASRQRMAKALAVHLSSTWPGSVVAQLRDTVYALVPAPQPADAEVRLERTCRSFLKRATGLGPCLIGIGRVASPTAVSSSRAEAHRALRVLTSRGTQTDVGLASDLEIPALLLEMQDLARAGSREPSGAYARILDYDRDKRSFMVETLQIWLEAGGDINEASARAHVHQNTFRYRLKRLSEVGEFVWDDPEERFALELQLRVYPPEEWLDRPDGV